MSWSADSGSVTADSATALADGAGSGSSGGRAIVTPNGGLAELARRIFPQGAAFSLVAYTNTPASLGSAAVAADLVQPPLAAGYAPITLVPARWNVDAAGVTTYTEPDGSTGFLGDPTWFATGSWGSNAVTGIAMVFGSILFQARDLQLAFVAAAGQKLRINLQDLLSSP
jgi:hypothetical protein